MLEKIKLYVLPAIVGAIILAVVLLGYMFYKEISLVQTNDVKLNEVVNFINNSIAAQQKTTAPVK